MPTLIFTFPGRRYHATPWGNHVNEGLLEWPPSPWRLLRALIGVGYAKGVWDEQGLPPVARDLVTKMCSVLPEYSVPQAVGAHSRHYMPLAVLDKGREKTTMVFDTWAQIDCGYLAVMWDVDLTDDERLLLSDLVAKMGYLGRAESWVEAQLIEVGEKIPEPNCYANEAPPPWGWEQVSLLAPQTGGNFDVWRQEAVSRITAAYPFAEGGKQTAKDRKLIAQRDRALEPYPDDLPDALQRETAWLQRHGWSQPPGSQRVLYWRKSDALRVGVPALKPTLAAPPVKAMLLSMATATRNRHALPPVTHSLIQGERLHKALVAKTGRHHRVVCGCDETGRPLGGRHDHAHVFPLDLDSDGQLDHFLVWATAGLDDAAQKAVRAVRKTFAKNSDSLYLALVASCNELKELASMPGFIGERLQGILGLDAVTEWVSYSPFVPPRHLKQRGKNCLEGQIAAELESRGLPAPADVQIIAPQQTSRYLRHRHYTRVRKLGPPPPIDCGFTIRLRLQSPITGPLTLGYGSHYGLGLFAPAERSFLDVYP